MIKVRVEGLPSLFLQGEQTGEDDRYIYLRKESGEDTRIPQSRVIYVENLGAFKPIVKHGEPVETQPVQPVIPQTIAPQASLVDEVVSTAKNRKTQKVQKALQDYVKKMRSPESIMKSPAQTLSGLSQIDPLPLGPDYDPTDVIPAEIVFEGAKEGGFTLDIPRELMNGEYSPALGREIFANQKLKSFLNGVVLDGVPIVEEDRVIYTTKEIATKTSNNQMNMQEKLKLAGTAMSMGTKAQDPSSIGLTKKPTQEFTMSASPFDVVPTLSLSEDSDEDS